MNKVFRCFLALALVFCTVPFPRAAEGSPVVDTGRPSTSTASAANGGGTKTALVVAPVAATASCTVSKIGTLPSNN